VQGGGGRVATGHNDGAFTGLSKGLGELVPRTACCGARVVALSLPGHAGAVLPRLVLLAE